MPFDASKLTVKQSLFIKEYLIYFDGTKAAIRAGYAKSSAHVQASALLKIPKIKDAIDKEVNKTLKAKDSLRERILAELELMAFSTITDYVEWSNTGGMSMRPSSEIDAQAMRMVASIEVDERFSKEGDPIGAKTKFKLYPKEKALELLMRHMGMLNDKLSLELPEPVVIKRLDGTEIVMSAKKALPLQEGKP